jgi:hypothetical protein
MSYRLPILAIAAVVAATAPAVAKAPGRPLFASLRGALEVPGPGKLDARGNAVVRVTPGRTRVCYTVSYRNIPAATMAHIHSGAAGVAGPPVLTLRAPNNGLSEGCATVSRALARDLVDHPGRFYVNVHSQAFPNGAIRGQLHR